MHPTVLFVGNHLSRENKNPSVGEALAVRLAESGWKTMLVSHRLNRLARLLDMLWTVWHRRKAYAVAQVDVFSGPGFLWAEWSAHLLHRLGKPFVLALHGGNLPEYASRHPARVRGTLAMASTVTAPSAYLAETMRPYRPDILMLPNPIDLPHYPFRLRSASRPALVWLRSFHQVYNPALAVQVLARLKNQGVDACLSMVGPDEGDSSLQQVIDQAEREKVSAFLSLSGGIPKKEVPVVLAQGDIFLNTTNVDNTPVSVIEAMACGLCIVSTNVGGVPYLLEHEKDALLVPPDDPEAMAAAVLRVLQEPDLTQKLSRNARKKVEKFDWPVVLPQWEELYESLMSYE